MPKLLFSIFLAAATAAAQTTFATITGTVTDASGAAIPNATVTATHADSNYVYRAAANSTGAYTIAQLLEGEYTVRVQAAGFKETRVREIRLVSLDVRRIDVRLEVGTVETSVDVTAGATLIETETARISDSKDSLQMKALPMNTRSLWNFIGLSPGVTQAGAGSSTRRFAGSRANQSDASIDGITLSNQYDGTQITPLTSAIESFEEARVDMANNTAEFGAVGQVTIVSKGGSNAFHGSAFDYYASPVFRARNPFAAQRGTGVRHNPGFSAGGPVVIPKLYNGRNRTFYYGSLETTRGSQILSNLNPTVPIASWRAGDFSRETAVVRDPFANNAPFAGNALPASRLSSVSRKFQDRFYPLPNFGDVTRIAAANFRTQLPRQFDPNTYWTTRIDHRFSDQHFVFGRYTWNRSYSRDYDNALPTVGLRWQTRDTRGINLSYTWTLRTNLINEARWGYAWNDNPRHGPLMGKEVNDFLGVTGLAPGVPDIQGLIRIGFTGVGITATGQTAWRHPGFKNFAQQLQDHVSWFRGKHNIKIGVVGGRTQFLDQNMPDALFGNLNFSNRYTNHPYADFLLGLPTTAQRGAPALFIDRLRWDWNFFATDEWKILPNLTANIGVRYEIHPAWDEASNRQSVFDLATGRIVIPNGTKSLVSPLVPAGYVDIVEASAAGYPNRLLRTDWNNLAPRLGLAWRPMGPNTVVRAGFGVFYDIVARPSPAGGSPFVVNEPSFNNSTPVPSLQFPRIFPDSVAGPTTITLPQAIRTDLRNPFSMQYNLTLEHQRWNMGFRASYIGTNTRQGEWAYNANQPVPDGRLFVNKPRLFPRYPNISYLSNGAGHQYHSLTLEAERKYVNGFAYQVSWVWARDIGDLERGESPENAFDRARERGVWLDIPKHRVTGNLIYEFPFGRGKRFGAGANRWLDAAIGGWELTSVYSIYSGQFLTPLWTGPDPTGTAFSQNTTPAQVTIRPNHLANANLAPEQRSTARWFDPRAFGAPTPGSFGSAARGVIFGPNSEIVNAGIAKQFRITEKIRLRWELTATNAFNTPNYANPNTNITQLADVGVLTSIGGDVVPLDSNGPRNLRTGLRLEW